MGHAWLAAAAAAVLAAAPASAEIITGFNGVFAPGQWTTTFSGTLSGASRDAGSAVMTASRLSISGGNASGPVPGSDAGCLGGIYGFAGPCQVSVTTTRILNPFEFGWSYATSDSSGPGADLFGMLIDGVRMQLSDPGGPITQSGVRSVQAGTSFGWYLNCTDCTDGAASVVVTAFQAGQAQVAAPGSLALLGAGALLGLAARRRRRGA